MKQLTQTDRGCPPSSINLPLLLFLMFSGSGKEEAVSLILKNHSLFSATCPLLCCIPLYFPMQRLGRTVADTSPGKKKTHIHVRSHEALRQPYRGGHAQGTPSGNIQPGKDRPTTASDLSGQCKQIMAALLWFWDPGTSPPWQHPGANPQNSVLSYSKLK